MASLHLSDWLTRIAAFNAHEIELGLERVARVWRRLGAPRLASQVVTVAGTNGKGSCAHFLERCLRAQSRSVGLYTSPHLLRFNERMRIDGVQISDEELCEIFAAVEGARQQEPLTFFEYTTLAALVWFSRARLDVVILEVGLGGRLDAVNIVASDVAIVTTIDLDHQGFLGDTRELIAREKAGIFRSGRAAVCGDRSPPAALRECASGVGAIARFRGDAFVCAGSRRRFTIRGEHYHFENLTRPPGAGLASFAAAIETLDLLRALPGKDQLNRVLDSWSLPGRLQRLDNAPVILDVAHNPQAGRALARALRDTPTAGTTRVILGMLADKAVDEFVAELDVYADAWLLVSLPGERGQSAAQLAGRVATVSNKPIVECASVGGALALAQARTTSRDLIVVCGSFQVVGPALAWLGIYSGPA